MDLLASSALYLRIAGLAVLAALGLLYVIALLPRGIRTRTHIVFIAAAPKTVWDTFFYHIGGVDYRPGIRKLGAEILSHYPLTVASTSQLDIGSEPMCTITVFDVYEPYTRYRSHIDGMFPAAELALPGDEAEDEPAEGEEGELDLAKRDAEGVSEEALAENEEEAPPEVEIYEEGEFESVDGGTRFTLRIRRRVRGFLVPWTAWRRTERNMASLKRVCEGGRPLPPRDRPIARRVVGWLGRLGG